mmetsp:Transcript_100151/g.161460  ORF Transcript_100151/g.161460 Transcript_100151/m.161460 type:complete len:293 (-) Transcript_100151:822-1700(-)
MMSSRRPAVRAGLRRAAENALTGGIARTHVLTAPASAAGTHFTAESSPLNTWRAARKVVQVHAGMLPRTLGGAGKSGEADGIWGTSRGGNVEDSRRDVVVRGIWAFLPTDLGKHVKQLAGTRTFSSPAVAAADSSAATFAPASTTPDKILNKAPHHDIPRARAVRKRFKTSVKKLNLVCKLVRRARVDAALMQLSLNSKRVAVTVRKAIYDAKFNAANNHGMDPDRLIVDEIVIGRSSYLKRVEYKGRGRTGVRKKPFCYMAVYVREIQDSDQFVYLHLKRRRPRWKCGPIK